LEPLNYTSAFVCNSMPIGCDSFWAGWALGGTNISFPEVAGLPMGNGSESGKYLVLQIHYNNPTSATNFVDTGSGFNLVYTPTLRQYDIGTLGIGPDYFTIPALDSSYSLAGPCPTGCTNKLTNPLNVLYFGVHMHTLGFRAWTQQIRNGVELPPLVDVPYYDFNFQSPVPAKPGTVIMPGDLLIHNCIWDSASRSTATAYGETTSNEMCYNFIIYYPLVLINQCFSVNQNVDGISVQAICRSTYTGELDLINYDNASYVPYVPPATTCQIIPTVASGHKISLFTLAWLLATFFLYI